MPVPTGLARDTTWISKKGSGFAAIQEVEANGDDLATPGTVYNFGPIKKSVYSRKPTLEKDSDQGGRSYTVGTTTEATMTMKIMQRDTVHLNLDTSLEDVHVRIYQELTDGVIDGKIQVLIVANAVIQPGKTVDGEDLHPEPVFDAFPVEDADVVILTTGFTGSAGASVGSQTIAVGEYEKIYEYTPA